MKLSLSSFCDLLSYFNFHSFTLLLLVLLFFSSFLPRYMLCSWAMFAHPLHIAFSCLCLHCSFIHKIHTLTHAHTCAYAYTNNFFVWQTLTHLLDYPHTLSRAVSASASAFAFRPHAYALFIDFAFACFALLFSSHLYSASILHLSYAHSF